MPATTPTWPWNNGTTSNPTTTTHQQAQPNSYILPNNNNNDFIRAKVIFHQPHQQNLQFPFTLISEKNQKFNLDHSDQPTTIGLSTDPAKKKRGRPRKHSADGNIDLGLSPTPVSQNPLMVNPIDPSVGGINTAASSENPSKKGCWRPPGFGKQQQQQRETSGVVGFGFTPHLINVNIGEVDVVSFVDKGVLPILRHHL
ncbi:hypothetical protein HAX54_031434 [Datura stramonium]|uniref:AT-hook motif nuclear-localized protein n=1 Tax=Datura stramonium TaxID=4076 RepID=A0ABS8SCQ4_DATST|nr:hypothetical protein [Datura stramonium]